MSLIQRLSMNIRYYCIHIKQSTKNPIKVTKNLVPEHRVKSKIDKEKLPSRTKIDADTIALLERLSLVDCANKKGIETLEAAIEFADQILQVNTTGVEPMYTVLEDKPLQVREDKVTEGNCKDQVILNTTFVEEDYFVAPPGNIPQEDRENLLYENDDKSKKCFLQKIVLPKFNTEQFKMGPVGMLLMDNIMREWFNFIVNNKDISVFLSGDDILGTFDFAKEMCLQTLPFGIAEVIPTKKFTSSDEIIEYYNRKKNEEKINFETIFRQDDVNVLKCTVFVSPNNATQFFHQWQKQRRIWWRKFSPSPGRYSLTDIKNGNDGAQYANIIVKYPWGSQQIESLTMSRAEKCYSVLQLQCKDGRKTVKASTITSQILSPTIFFNFICDAFEEPLFQDKPRTMLKLHRKMAPYKISFSVSASSSASISELNNLSTYLCRLLRSSNVSCLLLPSSYKHTLEAQYRQYDKLGIPYNIILNENTLKDGIVNLRSRDTTLKEQVHVSELVNYVDRLFKNY